MVTAYLQKQVHIIIITQAESILVAVKYNTRNKKRLSTCFFFYVRGQIPKPRGEKGPRGIKTPLKSHLRIS